MLFPILFTVLSSVLQTAQLGQVERVGSCWSM
ncbi:hypothetical protein F383_27570 [Gossypium arboreum]|uniref:Uncharacterized protein n=1 Tax=Gossypium arboreum TaxID=29729 RepID=A0A0B0P6K9_GOSAR|nr:hypothetical protein F383_27570 [Gossypium arboreum]